MSDDVLITPASRKVEFFDSGGNIDGKIELDSNGNLNITSTGSIAIGDITQDIHVGDGTQAVDLVFDFTSSIYSVAGQDLTIGKSSLGNNDILVDSPNWSVTQGGVLDVANLKIASAQGSDGQVLTSTGSGVAWEDASGGGAVSAVSNGSNNRVATFSSADALNGEANMTFDGSNLVVDNGATAKIRTQGSNNYAATLVAIAQGAHLGMGDIDNAEDEWLKFGAFGGINNLDTKTRDFHLYGTNTTTGFYFDESTGLFGIGTSSPGHKLHVTGPPDDSGDYAIYAEESSDNYAAIVNRHSGNRATAIFYRNIHADYTSQPMVTILQDHASDDQVCLYIKQDGTGNAVDVAGTINTANLTIGGAQGSDGQVLTSTGSGVAWEDATGGGTDTNTFVIVGEESDNYITSTAGAGNANGFQFSFGNGAQNTTKSSSGSDFGVALPVACTLTRIDVTFGNNGSETNSSNQTFTVFKNRSASTTTMTYNASGSGGNAFVRSFSSLSGDGLSYAAGDTFNLRTTGLSGYTNTQVGPARMTAYFTVA